MGDIGYLLDASYGQFSFDGAAALLQPVSGSSPGAPVSMSVIALITANLVYNE